MPRPQSYIGIKNSAEKKTVELHFTDFIYDGFDWNTYEYVNLVQNTIDKIKEANPETIKVLINSLGGDVMVGLALYNYLKNHPATVEVEVIGFAASIASVIAMSATPGKLKMAQSSFMIIHQAWSYAAGNAGDLREQANTLETISNELANIYALRSGKEAKYFTKAWADGDVWMTATEAKEIGLADELINADVEVHAAINEFGFKNVPAQFRAAASAGKPAADKGSEVFSYLKSLQNEVMSIKASLQKAFGSAKTDDKNKDVPGRDAVLDMVEAALAPVLDELDQAIASLKPAAATATTPPAAAAEVTPAVAETPVVSIAPKEKTIAELQAEIDALKNRVAASAMQPEEGKVSQATANASKWAVEY
jgi:ATP-dependent Clp endopeptidase proteolytic subunit ClpP